MSLARWGYISCHCHTRLSTKYFIHFPQNFHLFIFCFANDYFDFFVCVDYVGCSGVNFLSETTIRIEYILTNSVCFLHCFAVCSLFLVILRDCIVEQFLSLWYWLSVTDCSKFKVDQCKCRFYFSSIFIKIKNKKSVMLPPRYAQLCVGKSFQISINEIEVWF